MNKHAQRFRKWFGDAWAKGLLTIILPKRPQRSWDEMLKAAADQPPPPSADRVWNGAATAAFCCLLVLVGLERVLHFHTPQPVTLAEPVLRAPAKPVPRTTEVAVGTDGDMSFVMASVNGLEMLFMIDSGSSTICLPKASIDDLRRRGLLTEADAKGWWNFGIADGRIVHSKAYNLKRVTIGIWNLGNVAASDCGKNKVALLGQSVLGRFTSWSLDNQRNVLILTATPKE